MPELAEVAIYAKDLSDIAYNQTVTNIEFFNYKSGGSKIIPYQIRHILNSIIGKQIHFSSKGKSLLLNLSETDKPLVEIKLGMTGQFHLNKRSDHWKNHYFFSLQLSNGIIIYYADPRRFSRISESKDNEFYLGGYHYKKGFIKNTKYCIPPGYLSKPRISWLLDYGDKTGVGNYMANEALGLLNLSPFNPCSNINEASILLKTSLRIASKSYLCGGNSFNSGYFSLDGTEGKYYKYCKFYLNPALTRTVFRGRPVYTKFTRKRHGT